MKKIIKFAIGLSLITFIIYKVGFSRVIETISKINLLWIIPMFIIYFIALLIGAYNIHLLLSINKNKLRYSQVFWYYLISYSIGLFTPANLGEFYMAKLLKKHKIKISHGLTISAIDKLITIFVMIIISLIGILIFFREIINPAIPATTLVIFLIFLFISTRNRIKYLLKKILKTRKKEIDAVYRLLKKFIEKRKDILIINFLLTIIKLFIATIGTYFVFRSLGFNVALILIFFITIIARLISLIPITYDGLGVKESIAIILYGAYSISPAAVASMYLVYLFINYSLGSVTLIVFLNQTSNK